MKNTMSRLLHISLPVIMVAAAGCQDSTGPASHGTLNTQAALADYAAMDALLQSPGWKSFQMTAAGMEAAGVGGSAAVSAGGMMGSLATGDTRAFAQAMTGIASGASSRVPLISDANRGKTYVYDADANRWVIDAELTGAPATGVRFLTYEPMGAEPDPSKPTGYADLIDLGDAAAGVALQLMVVQGDMTVMDYQTTLSGAEGSGRVTVAGFLRNTQDQLDFDIDVRGQNVAGVERADITFDLGIADRAFRVLGDIHGENQAASRESAIDLTVRHGDASFRVDVDNQNGVLGGNIDLNDAAFATVSGPEHHPVFLTPAGEPLNGGQALVLWRIFDITEDVFDLFEDLVEPIAGLVIIAIIL